MKILFCSPTRLDRALAHPKVIIELAEGLTQLGCECKLIGPKDITSDLADGRHDPERYGIALRDYSAHMLRNTTWWITTMNICRMIAVNFQAAL